MCPGISEARFTNSPVPGPPGCVKVSTGANADTVVTNGAVVTVAAVQFTEVMVTKELLVWFSGAAIGTATLKVTVADAPALSVTEVADSAVLYEPPLTDTPNVSVRYPVLVIRTGNDAVCPAPMPTAVVAGVAATARTAFTASSTFTKP